MRPSSPWRLHTPRDASVALAGTAALATLLPAGGLPAAAGLLGMVSGLLLTPWRSATLARRSWPALAAGLLVLAGGAMGRADLCATGGVMALVHAWLTGPEGRAPAILLATLLAALGFMLRCPPESVILLVLLLVGTTGELFLRTVDGKERLPGDDGRHLARRLLLLVILATTLAAALFPTLPRAPERPPYARLVAMPGLEGEVSLNEFQELHMDPSPLVRVRFQGHQSGPVKLRGMAFNSFDGQGWTVQGDGLALTPAPTSRPEGAQVARIVLEPLVPSVILAPSGLLGMDATMPALYRDGEGNWLWPEAPRRLHYTTWAGERLLREPAPTPAHMALPPGLEPEVTSLALELAGGTGEETAAAISRWLSTETSYGAPPPLPEGQDAVSAFLLRHRTGRCELQATAAVVLARAAGVPARLVTGLRGGAWNEQGRYTVLRRQDAHAWAEVWVGGWATMDPSPPSAAEALGAAGALSDLAAVTWAAGVMGMDALTQRSILERLGLSLRTGAALTWRALDPWHGMAAAGVLTAMALTLAWRRLRRRAGERFPPGEVELAHREARRMVASRGWHVPPSLPPLAAARWLEERAGPEARSLSTIAHLHYRVRYAGDLDQDHGQRAREALAAMEGLPEPEQQR